MNILSVKFLCHCEKQLAPTELVRYIKTCSNDNRELFIKILITFILWANMYYYCSCIISLVYGLFELLKFRIIFMQLALYMSDIEP